MSNPSATPRQGRGQSAREPDAPELDAVAGASTDLLLRRPLVFFGVLLALVLGAVLMEHSLRPWRAVYSEPGLGGQWIWAAGAAEAGLPVAFWLVRDIDLRPEAISGARLAIVADEGYSLWVNGRRVGSRMVDAGRSRLDSDLYDVSGYLEPGVNRLLVEVQSLRGAGGLLASLRGADERPLLVTDERWLVLREARLDVMQGRVRLGRLGSADEGFERPVVWGYPPSGRWRARQPLGMRRLPVPRPARPAPRLPLRIRHPSKDSEWTDLDARSQLPALGAQSLFDFGEPVTGFLTMSLRHFDAAGRGALPALVFLSKDRPPLPGLENLRPDVVAVPMPGSTAWRDLHPRTFRYVAVVGPPPQDSLFVEPVTDAEAGAWTAPAADTSGVFGLDPSRSYTAVEELVWRRLGGVERARQLAETQSLSN